MLGGGDGVGGGRVHHKATELGGRLQVDIVDPHPSPADHLEPPLGRLEHLPRHLRPAPNHQRVHQRDLGTQLLRRQVVRALHLREAAEQLEPGLAELLRDQHRWLGGRGGRNLDLPAGGGGDLGGGENGTRAGRKGRVRSPD